MVEEEYQADTGTDDEGSLSIFFFPLFYRFLYLHIWSIRSAMLNYKCLSCLSCYESLSIYRKKAKLYWSIMVYGFPAPVYYELHKREETLVLPVL